MTKIISFANFKGGTGKTTSTINVGAAIANTGRKVLLIDLDPQFNLSQSLGIEDPLKTIYGLLNGQYAPDPITISAGLDVIPSSLELIKAETELFSKFQRELVLQRILDPLKRKYDFILIDCPPALGNLTITAFVASDLIFVPVQAEFLALKGYAVLSEAIGNIGLEIDKVFITRYDGRKILNRSVKDNIIDTLQDKAFRTVIRENVALAEAPINGLDIFRYDPKSYGAEDYTNLVNEILAL